MPAKIKLVYFNAKGRAELSRLILAQAGVEYDDVRFEREEWPVHKQNMPLGQIPILEFDGTTISQSLTIARFLAKEFGLAGKNNLEQAQAEMIIDAGNDLANSMYAFMFERDEEKKKTLEETFKNETLPNYLKNMEKILTSRGGKHFAGDALTFADIGVAMVVTGLKERVGEDAIKPFPKLSALRDHVYNLPKIKHWVETRPQTAM